MSGRDPRTRRSADPQGSSKRTTPTQFETWWSALCEREEEMRSVPNDGRLTDFRPHEFKCTRIDRVARAVPSAATFHRDGQRRQRTASFQGSPFSSGTCPKALSPRPERCHTRQIPDVCTLGPFCRTTHGLPAQYTKLDRTGQPARRADRQAAHGTSTVISFSPSTPARCERESLFFRRASASFCGVAFRMVFQHGPSVWRSRLTH